MMLSSLLSSQPSKHASKTTEESDLATTVDQLPPLTTKTPFHNHPLNKANNAEITKTKTSKEEVITTTKEEEAEIPEMWSFSQ